MNFPRVSIITPAYNAEKFIAETIQSVLAQTYTDWEMIIVDDGSTDNTAEAIKPFLSDCRIKYLYQQNGRQGKARNKAICHAKGEYIAFLDADDLWIPEKLAKQIQSIEETAADLVFSSCISFETGQPDIHLQNGLSGYYKGEETLKKFLESNYIPVLTVLVKKEAVKAVNSFSEKPKVQNAEDYHLWLKLLAAGYVFWASAEYLAYYRMHSFSATASDRGVIFSMLASLEELTLEYPEKKALVEECYVKQINNYFCQNIITDWQKVLQLLYMKQSKTGKREWFLLKKPVYKIFGQRIFRYFCMLSFNPFALVKEVPRVVKKLF